MDLAGHINLHRAFPLQDLFYELNKSYPNGSLSVFGMKEIHIRETHQSSLGIMQMWNDCHKIIPDHLPIVSCRNDVQNSHILEFEILVRLEQRLESIQR